MQTGIILKVIMRIFTQDYESTPGVWNTTRSTSAEYNRDFRQTYNGVLNYNQTLFRDHHVDIMLGMEYYNRYYRGFSAAGQGAPTDDFGDLGLTDSGEWECVLLIHIMKMQRILSFFGSLEL